MRASRLFGPAKMRSVASFKEDRIVKWAGMYLIGFIVLIAGVLAALWKLGLLATIEPAWIVIGVIIVLGFGIMLSVSQSGRRESIEIDRK